VGTSSARAGLVEHTESGGKLVKFHAEEITIFKPSNGLFEQSSSNIWQKVCECIRIVTSEIADKSKIKGLGFDATCSLVLLDKYHMPLTVSPTSNSDQNIIMWLDHRAEEEANFINSLQHDCLQYVGGKVSLEMEIPKLLWLKKNMRESFRKIHYAFDLPDFLTFRATGKDSRSVCSLVCKWNYDAVKGEFPKDYFTSIGLEELCEDNFEKIGNKILFPGDLVGELTAEAAKEMNLCPGIAVATSMIDAHAGAIGLIGSTTPQQRDVELTSKLVLIAGTSTCHMSITKNILFCPGIWGPYKNALIPNFFLHEAGQSACGILIDHILTTHPDYDSLLKELNGSKNIHDHLYCELLKMSSSQNLKSVHELTRHFHFYPDFHGNRSPIGDPTITGMVSGLTMHTSIVITYLAIIQALAYSTKHIIESLYEAGREEFKSILVCGGLSKNRLFVQTTADVCKMPVLISAEPESVLIGASMLGATASGAFATLEESISELKNDAYQIEPDWHSFDFHDRKYRVYLQMLQDQSAYKTIMNE
jgi:FGGY-family pentulose kinase